MLARRGLSPEYLEWNTRNRAPFGVTPRGGRLSRALLPARTYERLRGPFQYQPNNLTRKVEYPWAFDVARLRPGLDVLEIGGGLSGFQFVLDQAGCRVINVDPGMESDSFSWPCNQASVDRLNRIYHTAVQLRNTTLPEAGLPSESIDVAFSISVLEHLDQATIEQTICEVFRVLRPGGRLILTVDLFLNVHPFVPTVRNAYGTNVDVRAMCAAAPFELEFGRTDEMFGFPEFDAQGVLQRLHEFFIGDYPALAQCLVLKKPAAPSAE